MEKHSNGYHSGLIESPILMEWAHADKVLTLHSLWRLRFGGSTELESQASVITQKSCGLAGSLGFRHYSWSKRITHSPLNPSQAQDPPSYISGSMALPVHHLSMVPRWSRVISMILNSFASSNFPLPRPCHTAISTCTSSWFELFWPQVVNSPLDYDSFLEGPKDHCSMVLSGNQQRILSSTNKVMD